MQSPVRRGSGPSVSPVDGWQLGAGGAEAALEHGHAVHPGHTQVHHAAVGVAREGDWTVAASVARTRGGQSLLVGGGRGGRPWECVMRVVQGDFAAG